MFVEISTIMFEYFIFRLQEERAMKKTFEMPDTAPK